MNEKYTNEKKIERIRNYFTPILNYFKMKKDLENENISEDRKNELEKIINLVEPVAEKSVEKIVEILKKE